MKNIKTILCGLYTLAAIFFAAGVSAQPLTYTHNGTTLKLHEVEVNIGIEKPFSVLHISDSHLAYADERDDARKNRLSVKRRKNFGDSEGKLRAHIQYALDNNMIIVHSGDMLDFVSEANLDCAKDIFSKGDWIVCAGNHEYSLYMGEAKEDAAYRAKSYDKVQAVFPNDLTFYSRVVNGVNFVTLDVGYYKVSKEQFAKMKKEVKKGLPIIMVCHNPLYTPDLCNYALKRWKGKSAYLVGVPEEITSKFPPKTTKPGEEWRNRSVQQHADKTTLKFCKWLKKQEELKAILCGHLHFNFKTQFSPTATQYVVDKGTKGVGCVVHIK